MVRIAKIILVAATLGQFAFANAANAKINDCCLEGIRTRTLIDFPAGRLNRDAPAIDLRDKDNIEPREVIENVITISKADAETVSSAK